MIKKQFMTEEEFNRARELDRERSQISALLGALEPVGRINEEAIYNHFALESAVSILGINDELTSFINSVRQKLEARDKQITEEFFSL